MIQHDIRIEREGSFGHGESAADADGESTGGFCAGYVLGSVANEDGVRWRNACSFDEVGERHRGWFLIRGVSTGDHLVEILLGVECS